MFSITDPSPLHQGITIKPVVLFFRVKKKTEAEPCLTERITNRMMDSAKTAIEDILGDNSEIPMRFRNFYKVSLYYDVGHDDKPCVIAVN